MKRKTAEEGIVDSRSLDYARDRFHGNDKTTTGRGGDEEEPLASQTNGGQVVGEEPPQ